MSEAVPRLRRLIAEEVGVCCEADVERRLEELEALSARVPTDATADLRALSTIADDTRYRIVRLLVAAENELCVCELNPLVEVSESALSHALSDLTEAGLVTRRKGGRWRYYRATELAERLVTALDTTDESDR